MVLGTRMSKSRKTRNGSSGNGKSSHTGSVPEQHVSLRTAPLLSAVAFIALVLAFFLYSPALSGPFLFDDIGLPFYQLSFPHESIGAWLAGVRPMLMLSYWANFQVSGRDPWTYHAFNVLLHAANTVLVFILLSRILQLLSVESRRAFFFSGIAAYIFLAHPLQTETVAYIAGRSELVCGFFMLSALAVFCNPALTTITWRTAAILLLLYCCAVLSKEQAVVLPAVFLALDLVVRRRSLQDAVKRGAWLYGPIAVLGVGAVVGVAVLLARSNTAGFNVPGILWYEYLFTQFRVWLIYLGLAVLPFRQNADYDIALSHTLGEHGAGIALAVLIVTALAIWRWRGRFPLLFAGALVFAILIAPTSSLIPIQDVAAERRMYIPLVGVLLVAMQALLSLRSKEIMTAGMVAYLLICSALTYERTKIWGSDVALWSDITAQSPRKARGYTHLTYAYIRGRRCPEAVKTALRAPENVRDTPEFLGMLGHAYACGRQMPEAINAFERAVLAGPGVGRMLALASTYRQAGRQWDAEAAEQQAMRLTPRTPYDFFMLDAIKNARGESTRSRSAPAEPVP